ncbi:FAD/NAD(P)-binding protein [Shouchella shacheensis]|uniref:FAD/NAD(P)-binding protein n=1 Tax=Shouchella shacheensis TaxID=1649580 RepID=UPI00073FD621|nr:FAD/NAD(P)-binding protein [Shouchella shacheensis]
MKKWAIIGGGIQGSTLAIYLVKKKKARVEEIEIIDPHEEPLALWKEYTKRIGMPYLRSPSVHHLDVPPFGLEKYGKTYSKEWKKLFNPPYDRPSLAVFNSHSVDVFRGIGLEASWKQGRVQHLERENPHWKLYLCSGETVKAKQVALAFGITEQPYWPEWALEKKGRGDEIYHVFGESLPAFEQLSAPFVIYGGGISAAHLSLKLSKKYPGNVTLKMRHPFRTQQFDADPGWMGARRMKEYSKIKNYEKRRMLIKEARHRGSMPAELKTAISKAAKSKQLRIVQDQETFETFEQEGTILLATGFRPDPPGMEWLRSTMEREKLPVATCGYPILSETLEWGKGLYAIGALAELQIGPVSRNIAGARRGALKIVGAL